MSAPAHLDAASRHEHLVVYDPAAIPAGTPFDPDLEAQEPDPLPEPALRALAAGGHALVLHYPEEDCEATVRVMVGDPPVGLRTRGRAVLDGARLAVASGRLIADGAEFLHGAEARRTAAEEAAAAVPPGEYAVSVLNLIPWKLAHREDALLEATTPAARRLDRARTVLAIAGAALIPAHLVVVPVVLALTWKRRGIGGLLAALLVIAAVDAVVLGAVTILEKLRGPELAQADAARQAFERENPDVLVCLRPWRGGDAKPAWAELRSA